VQESVILYTDGGSRGNPGPAAAAFIITSPEGNQIQARAFYLGQTTNNIAEYTALLKGLSAAKESGARKIKIRTDSELVARQVGGQYKVKNPGILEIYSQVMHLLSGFESWGIEHIYREANKPADELANRAMDLKRDVEASAKPAKPKTPPIRLGILISGGGRTMLNINDQIKAGRLNAKIAIVISSRSNTAGIERAKAAGLPVTVVRKKDFPDIAAFSKEIAAQLEKAGVDLVVQGGWLCLWHIPAKYTNRVMNIHPALLPSFGGEGMWGHHVHEAVLKAGCKVSGCTVHFCTNEYDKGPIIIQRCCPVLDTDTADMLAERVFEQECIAYPEAIRLFARGGLGVCGNIVKIKPEE
jgi:phosphoribosylglycinamide formyltransferase-1